MHYPYKKVENNLFTNNFLNSEPNPNQFRWMPFDVPSDKKVDFIDGIYIQIYIYKLNHIFIFEL